MRLQPLMPILNAAVLFGALLVSAPAADRAIVLDVDTGRTTVQFTLADVLHTVHGSFKVKHGSLRVDPATGTMGGEVVVDATSGASGSDGRDRRMHKDILESSRYAEIVFTPDRLIGAIAAQGASDVQVHGTIRIHGAANEVTLPVHVQMEEGKPAATTRFTIPYVKWGLKNPSNLILRVSDKVEIEIAAYAK